MGQAIPVRTAYTAGEVRRLAQRAKDAARRRDPPSPASLTARGFAVCALPGCVTSFCGGAPFWQGLSSPLPL